MKADVEIKKSRIWLIIVIVIASYLGLTILRLAQYAVVRSCFVRWSFLNRIVLKVYIDPEMVQADRDFLLAVIEESRIRISSMYGNSQADPVIIAGLPDWFDEGLALQVDERFTEEDWLNTVGQQGLLSCIDSILQDGEIFSYSL